MSNERAYVLLSGGIDSTTCLYLAKREFDEVHAVSINYGQRHSTEMVYARKSCAYLEVPHHTVDLSAVVPRTMLTDDESTLPNVSYDEISGVSPTYVPFRNGLMLSALASFVSGKIAAAQVSPSAGPGGKSADEKEWAIYFGAHAEDAQNWAYPDCTPEFIGAVANAIYIGTYGQIRLHTPLEWLGKSSIIQLGTQLGVNWELTWSCYKGGDVHCGVCPTCRARRKGFIDAGVHDPTPYLLD